MTRDSLDCVALTLACLLLSAHHRSRADVRAEEKTHVEFAGMLGSW